MKNGEDDRSRICNIPIKSRRLYQLSYILMVGTEEIESPTYRLKVECSTS